MNKMLALLLALAMFVLAACGTPAAEPAADEEPLTRSAMPEVEERAEPVYEEPEELDWDLAICQPEEAYREIEHYNIDPTGYRGLRLRVAGEFSVYQDHGKTFYYVGVRDEDGCVENLELRFPGDGGIPEDFPGDGGAVSAWGILAVEETLRDGETLLHPVLTEVGFLELPDFRD